MLADISKLIPISMGIGLIVLAKIIWDMIKSGSSLISKSIHREARFEKLHDIEKLLSEGKDVNEADNWGRTGLHFACKDGNIEIVTCLLNHKAKVNLKSVGRPPQGPMDEYMDWTPLHYAVINGNLEVVEMLLKANAKRKVADWAGRIPLHYAALYGNQTIVKRLLELGDNVNAKDNAGFTPLWYVVLGYGGVPNTMLVNPPERSQEEGQKAMLETAKILLEAKADISIKNEHKHTMLMKTENVEMARILVQYGIDINFKSEGGTALKMNRGFLGNKEMADYLESIGVVE